MKAWIDVDDDGRIGSSTTEEAFSEGMIEVELPDDFDFMMQADYIYKDGELVHDGKATEELQEAVRLQQEQRKLDNQLKVATRMLVRSRSADLTDAEAYEVSMLLKTWTVGETYTQGEVISYGGELYRCGQPSITASETYKPGDEGTAALYSHIERQGEYEVWQAWDGVSGIYALGQVVIDPEDGKAYESLVQNNVWGPPHSQTDLWKLKEE